MTDSRRSSRQSEEFAEVEHVTLHEERRYDEELGRRRQRCLRAEKGIAIGTASKNLLQQSRKRHAHRGWRIGTCEMCAQPIHPDRLKALPYARLCINCKEREEQAIPR